RDGGGMAQARRRPGEGGGPALPRRERQVDQRDRIARQRHAAHPQQRPAHRGV
ncbi:MAG: hypothetical protein AVDCRST_MAG88-1930, partial [uncultured Thermomicrobiales bacterium]